MELQISTLLGGANVDLTHGMTASSDGSVYVTGETWSQGFPILSPFQYDQGGNDAFVSKLYLGGDSNCSSGIDSDQDGIDDLCDTCINVRPVVTISPADMAVRMKSAYYYYPNITDSDGGPFDVTYLEKPHWCTTRNDSVVGVAPDTAFVEPIEFELVDGCNIDTISFNVSVYLCGNANGDTLISITDPVFIINFIFAGGPAPQPQAQGDADCNGVIHIGDAVYLINYIFAGGPSPCAACP